MEQDKKSKTSPKSYLSTITQDKLRIMADSELVEMALKNQAYFVYIMKKYKNRLLIYIQRISNVSYEDAEDILQNVFIKVYKNLNDFDKSLKFSSWIYRITRNETINHWRKTKSRPENITKDFENNDILEQIVSDIDIERNIDLTYLRNNIYKILDNIDYKYKEILILKFLEEKDYKEISDILKKPMGTIASLMNRAKKEFKKTLDKQELKINKTNLLV